MLPSRVLPLYDPNAQPPTWSERMAPGEFAVLTSMLRQGNTATGPTCAVFTSLEDAESYAKQEVAAHTDMRCMIYDHDGLGKDATAEIRGTEFKEKGEMSQRTRRWVCGVLLLGGATLFIFDWVNDFRYMWPSMIGSRMVPTGLLLLAFEVGVEVEAAHKRRKALKSQG
jgi:hypothetical protein